MSGQVRGKILVCYTVMQGLGDSAFFVQKSQKDFHSALWLDPFLYNVMNWKPWPGFLCAKIPETSKNSVLSSSMEGWTSVNSLEGSWGGCFLLRFMRSTWIIRWMFRGWGSSTRIEMFPINSETRNGQYLWTTNFLLKVGPQQQQLWILSYSRKLRLRPYMKPAIDMPLYAACRAWETCCANVAWLKEEASRFWRSSTFWLLRRMRLDSKSRGDLGLQPMSASKSVIPISSTIAEF